MAMEARALMALCTCPSQEVAERIARTVVEEGHAACANLIPGLTSFYAWQGEIHQDPELLLLIKTTPDAYPGLEATIQRLHPYELPEIIAVPVVKGLAGYLQWIAQSTQRES
jgi:periplasmic divalent cation tolerance protein